MNLHVAIEIWIGGLICQAMDHGLSTMVGDPQLSRPIFIQRALVRILI
jgi:hypothetical protein